MSSDDRRDDPRDPHDDPWSPDSARGPLDGPRQDRARGRVLLRVAVVLFAVGVLFSVLAAVVPIALGRDAPTVLYLGAMFFTPAGFLLGLASAFLGSRPPGV
ncbi:hypothetical protein [Dietzia sp. 179-F 9C3 NHS]|uniref:hypothetical protein n=1 Tax=Dietzia sp. 179-F 9C3 NHS TaxID=3374295 RepID=UPI003879A66F